jgi:hypothetical protein
VSYLFFMFSAPGYVFSGIEGVRSFFHVLRSRTRFRLYRGRRVPFSCFALSHAFSAVPRALGPIFMFCAARLIFGDTEGVRSLFHVLRSRTCFHWYRGRPIPFSCFSLPDLFLAVPRSSGPFFMFCALGHVFDGTKGVKSLFHVLLSRTRFWRYRGRRVSFFRFSAPGFVFGGTDGVQSCFHVFRYRTCFLRYRGRRVPF